MAWNENRKLSAWNQNRKQIQCLKPENIVSETITENTLRAWNQTENTLNASNQNMYPFLSTDVGRSNENI